MANASILAAFERFWQHIVAVVGNKADIDHTHSLEDLGAAPQSAGLYIVNGRGATDTSFGITTYSVTLPQFEGEYAPTGTRFIMIPDTGTFSAGTGLLINNATIPQVIGRYQNQGDRNNATTVDFEIGKPYLMTYDGSIWVADDMNTAPRVYDTAITTTGSSTAYSATVPDIKSLNNGMSFIMIPHVTSTVSYPTLNVNGLGAKDIMRNTSNTDVISTGGSADWLRAGHSYRVIYDGGQWIVEGDVLYYADDISGTVQVSKGGTGATDAVSARKNLGIYQYSGNIASSSSTAANAMHEQILSAKTIFGLSSIPSTFQVVAGVSLNANMNLTVAHTVGTDEIKVRMRNVSGASVGATTFYYSIIGMVR